MDHNTSHNDMTDWDAELDRLISDDLPAPREIPVITDETMELAEQIWPGFIKRCEEKKKAYQAEQDKRVRMLSNILVVLSGTIGTSEEYMILDAFKRMNVEIPDWFYEIRASRMQNYK